MKQEWGMIITLNMTLCYKETEEELFFKEQLGQKPKGCSETSSVSTTHHHGKHEMLSNGQNKLSEQMGRKHCCQGGDPNSLQESESLHRLTDQPTQKCLYSPCQEDAGTDVGCACLQLPLFGCNFPGMEETLFYFFPSFLLHKSEGTTPTTLLQHKDPGPKLSWSHGCCSQKRLS